MQRDNRTDERLFIFTLATTASELSEGCSLHALREQRYAANYLQTRFFYYLDVADAYSLVRAVRHFLIIVDELMNETKWIL